MKTDPYASGMADHTIRGVPRVWVEGRSTLACPPRRPISRRQPENRRSPAFSQRSGAQQARETQSENRSEYTYSSVNNRGPLLCVTAHIIKLPKTYEFPRAVRNIVENDDDLIKHSIGRQETCNYLHFFILASYKCTNTKRTH